MIMGEERRRGQGTETRSEGRRRLCLRSKLLHSPSVHVSMCEICFFSIYFSISLQPSCNCLLSLSDQVKENLLGLKEAESCCGGGERGISVSGELEPVSLCFPSIISAFTKDSVNFRPFGSKCSCSPLPLDSNPRRCQSVCHA